MPTIARITSNKSGDTSLLEA
jgi:Sec7-like guanine-nucleotide exchange factor